MSKLSGLAKTVLWVKGSILAFILGGIYATENSTHVNQLEYNLLDKNQSVAENFFHDPPGLDVTWRSNYQGKIESFLQYNSGDGTVREVEILEDMMPANNTIARTLNNRLNLEGVMLSIEKNKLYLSDVTSGVKKEVSVDLLKSDSFEDQFMKLYDNLTKDYVGN